MKTSFGTSLKIEMAKRMVRFSIKQEKRTSLSPDAIEEIINHIHTLVTKWTLGTKWKWLEARADIQGKRMATRRAIREATYASNHLHNLDATLEYHEDGTLDAGTTPQSPETALNQNPLTKRQIRYALATIKQTGNLPPIMHKRLRKRGLSEIQIRIFISKLSEAGGK